MPFSDLPQRAAEVRDRIAAAVARGGRGQTVTVVAVTKSHGPAAGVAAAGAGGVGIGENRGAGAGGGGERGKRGGRGGSIKNGRCATPGPVASHRSSAAQKGERPAAFLSYAFVGPRRARRRGGRLRARLGPHLRRPRADERGGRGDQGRLRDG